MSTSSVSKDLLLAILSMDAYNQGYTPGLIHGANQIGSATVRALPNGIDINDWESAGFYGVAYDTPYGKVISYRGTDSYLELFSTDIPTFVSQDFERQWAD